MRTTLDIDEPVLKELKRLQKRHGKSLGRLASDLLAWAIGQRGTGGGESPVEFRWSARSMVARVDPADRETVWAVMEERPLPSSGKRRK